MQSHQIKIPPISETDLSLPVVQALFSVIQQQADRIQNLEIRVQELRDEVARLKNQTGKPDIKPSNLDKKSDDHKSSGGGGKRAGSDKKSKKDIPIHEIIRLKPAHLPPGSIFKGVMFLDKNGHEFSHLNAKPLLLA